MMNHFMAHIVRLPTPRTDDNAERGDGLRRGSVETKGPVASLGGTKNNEWRSLYFSAVSEK